MRMQGQGVSNQLHGFFAGAEIHYPVRAMPRRHNGAADARSAGSKPRHFSGKNWSSGEDAAPRRVK
jgi:hypothetical protein